MLIVLAHSWWSAHHSSMSGAQVLSLWMWLSLRLGEEAFPGHARAVEAASSMVELMDLGLQALSQRQVTRRLNHACRND